MPGSEKHNHELDNIENEPNFELDEIQKKQNLKLTKSRIDILSVRDFEHDPHKISH